MVVCCALLGSACARISITQEGAPDPASAADSTQPDGSTAPPERSDDPDTNPDDAIETTQDRPGVSGIELSGTVDIADVVKADNNLPDRPLNGVIAHSIVDIEQWWSETFPELYDAPYTPLSGGVYPGYRDRSEPIPGCDDEPTTSQEDLSEYVAFYCPEGDFIAFDDSSSSDLIALSEEYGDSVIGLVISHEWGHAIQSRAGIFDQPVPTIYTEQQADCFAGAWVARVYRGESEWIRFGEDQIRTALVALLAVRDPVGASQFDAGGHGSAFDRVGAFQEGFLNGAERCVPLIDDPLPLIPNVLRYDELANGGNAPFSCDGRPEDECSAGPEFLATDLNDFWSKQTPGFSPLSTAAADTIDGSLCSDFAQVDKVVGLCPAEGLVYFDEAEIRSLYDEIGDFSLGYLYGLAWAEHAISDEAIAVDGEDRALLRDCATGLWVRSITPDDSGQQPRSEISISAGDLDEAIRMALLIGDSLESDDVVGSPFEKIAALRSGTIAGDCSRYSPTTSFP